MSRITENDMVKKTTLSDGTRISYIVEGTSEHRSDSYRFRIENGYFVAEVAGENENFASLQKKRKEGGKVRFESQLDHRGYIDVPNVGTSAALFGDFKLKNGEHKELLICNTRQKKEGLWASAISGYVNALQAEGTKYSPIFYTLLNELHEEVLIWESDTGEAVVLDFGEKLWPIFGYTGFKKKLKAREVSVDKIDWLHTNMVKFPGNEGFPCFIDTRCNNAQAVGAYEVSIDLSKYKLTSSETRLDSGKLYEEFHGGQGEGSHLILLDADNPIEGNAFKPDCSSDTGLVEVPRPKVLSEFFTTQINSAGIAFTEGDKVC